VFLRYVGPPGQYYPTIPLEPEFSVVYDLEANPGDGNWEPLGDITLKAVPIEPPAETSLSVNVHPDEEI
jgi:hypothetical protein